MIPVNSPHPPGAICISTGELTRYAMFQQDLAVLRVPGDSTFAWSMGPLIAMNMDTNFSKSLIFPADHPRAGERTPFQWVWILGDDHTFAPDTLMRLLDRQRETGADILIPACLNRQPPCAFTIVDESNGRHRDFDKVPPAPFTLESFEVCGDAGMLMSRRAVEALGPPWYEHLISGTKISEDRWFAHKIRAAGFEIMVDPTVTLGHITPCIIEPVWDAQQGWLVRFSVGRTPLVQFRPIPDPVLEPETALA